MTEPEKREHDKTEQDEQEEVKKSVDSTVLTFIALGSCFAVFWVINLVCTRWNIDPGQDLLLALVFLACQPVLCLWVYRSRPQSLFVERALKVSAYLSLATAVVCVGGVQMAHVVRHGWSHWDCLGADQKWRDRHTEIYGTVVAFRCGAEECTRNQAALHPASRMVVEFDRRAWYEARPGPADADCFTASFNFKSGSWLPNLGCRVATSLDACQSSSSRTDAVWHPIR